MINFKDTTNLMVRKKNYRNIKVFNRLKQSFDYLKEAREFMIHAKIHDSLYETMFQSAAKEIMDIAKAVNGVEDETKKKLKEIIKSQNHKDFNHTQEVEAKSWLIEDEAKRKEKASKEAIRYPLLKKQMGLNFLDTSEMIVADIGAGPLGGVSSVIHCREVHRFDPLADAYTKYYPLNNYHKVKAEDIAAGFGIFDLIIITNALDHFEKPLQVLENLARYMKYGAYFAHLHAINNAFTHPHEGHAHNVNPEMFREYLDADFECVWYLDYQNDNLTYGWRKQPAFSGLYRKVTGL